MLSRIAIFIIASLILVIVVFLGYNFIKGVLNFRDKIITVTADNIFDPSSISVANTENVKIRNNSSEKQIILDADTNQTLAEVDSKKTSKRLDLAENTRTNLTLADYNDASVIVTVGSVETSSEEESQTPIATATPTTVKSPTPTPSTASKTATGSASGNKLPGTGAEDYLPLLLMIISGLYLGRQALIYRNLNK